MMLKWGIIGCGGIADRRTIPGMMLSETSRPYAVMDVNLEVANKVKEKYGATYAFDNIDELLALPEIEAVYIASPVFCHKEQALAAAKAGKHILIEKPVGFTTAETEEIINTCDKCGVKLGVGFMMRYHAYHQAMKQLVADGVIGDVVSMRAQFVCWYPDSPGLWRQEKRYSGGGALMDLGVHCIDILQYITGLSAVECTGYAHTQTFSYDVDDCAVVLMKMNNGAHAYVDVAFNLHEPSAGSPVAIYGTKGSIVANDTLSQVEGGELTVITMDGEEPRRVEVNVEFGNMYAKEIDAFARAIVDGTEPPVNGKNTLLVQRIVDAIYSGKGGRF